VQALQNCPRSSVDLHFCVLSARFDPLTSIGAALYFVLFVFPSRFILVLNHEVDEIDS